MSYGFVKRRVRLDAVASLAGELLVLVVPALVLVVLSFVHDDGIPHEATGVEWLLVLGTGVITAAPLLLFAYAAKRVPFTILGPANYLIPIINFLLGWLVFDEALTTSRLVGFALVWLALVLVTVDAVSGRACSAGQLAPSQVMSATLTAASKYLYPLGMLRTLVQSSGRIAGSSTLRKEPTPHAHPHALPARRRGPVARRMQQRPVRRRRRLHRAGGRRGHDARQGVRERASPKLVRRATSSRSRRAPTRPRAPRAKCSSPAWRSSAAAPRRSQHLPRPTSPTDGTVDKQCIAEALQAADLSAGIDEPLR